MSSVKVKKLLYILVHLVAPSFLPYDFYHFGSFFHFQIYIRKYI